MSSALEPSLQDQARLSELGLMVAGLGHELRQPLFAIKALAQVMQQGESSPEMITSMLEQIQHMEQLLDGVGCYSRRPQAQGIVDVDGTVAQVVRWLQPRARRNGLRLEVSAGAGRAACMDPVALTQVLVNLSNNAIDAATGLVTVQAECVEQRVIVRVRDDGPGLSVRGEQAFEPFFTTKAPGKGTGLGLSIARQLAREFGGDLELEESDRGACFALLLPAA